MKLDYHKCSKEDIENALGLFAEKGIKELALSNICPFFLEDEFDMEIDEVEGNWDMDWWGTLHFNGVQIHAFGSARYGTAALNIEEE